MITAEHPTEVVLWSGNKRRAFTVGDTVTVHGSPGLWRIAAFFGREGRMHGNVPLIADLQRIDRKWAVKTSAYVTALRTHTPITHQERS